MQNYPIPDRSDFAPNTYVEDAFLPERDLGALGGVFPDGRPYRTEFWCTEGMTLMTVFFSTRGLERHSAAELLERVRPLLEAAHTDESWRRLDESCVLRVVDAAGNEMFSLTFVVGMPEF